MDESLMVAEEQIPEHDAEANTQAPKEADPRDAAREIEFDRLSLEIRSRSHVIERSDLTLLAKQLHEELHPEAKQGGAPGRRGGGKSKSPTVGGFVATLAERTLRSPSSIHGDLEIAQRIAADVRDRLRETPLAMQTTTLLALARLPRKSRHRLQRQLSEAYVRVRTEQGDRAAEKTLKTGIAEHRPPVERRAALPPLMARTRPIRVAEGASKRIEYCGRAIVVTLVGVGEGGVRVALEVAEAVEAGESG